MEPYVENCLFIFYCLSGKDSTRRELFVPTKLGMSGIAPIPRNKGLRKSSLPPLFAFPAHYDQTVCDRTTPMTIYAWQCTVD